MNANKKWKEKTSFEGIIFTSVYILFKEGKGKVYRICICLIGYENIYLYIYSLQHIPESDNEPSNFFNFESKKPSTNSEAPYMQVRK